MNLSSVSRSVAMLPLRLRRVAGFEGRLNDALFQPATRPVQPAQTLVFFGGDVQDYPEVMLAHRDNRNYVKWNLESTARMLGTFFPDKHILVIKPSRIEYKSFSCYDNFVPSNNAGVPDHTATHSALKHLQRLLEAVSNRIKTMQKTDLLEIVTAVTLPEEIDIEDLHSSSIHRVGSTTITAMKNAVKPQDTHSSATNMTGSTSVANATLTNTTSETAADMKATNTTEAETTTKAEDSAAKASKPTDVDEIKPDSDPLWWQHGLSLEQSRLTLVGFSKGCVVLNQCIYEFHYTQTLTPGDRDMHSFVGRIEAMYWLDGGHAGGKNTWVTSRNLLETLTRLNMNLYVHVSPYQVCDEGRPWIGREEKTFTSILTKLGAKISRYMHASDASSAQSLHMHFRVLDSFHSVQYTPDPDRSDDHLLLWQVTTPSTQTKQQT